MAHQGATYNNADDTNPDLPRRDESSRGEPFPVRQEAMAGRTTSDGLAGHPRESCSRIIPRIERGVELIKKTER